MSVSDPKSWHRIGREWLVALSAYALLVAPFGCQFESLLSGGANAGPWDTNSVGLLVNSDASDALLAAGRAPGGDTFFVYGTRTTDGGIEQVESLLVETADGRQSFILFDADGRPTHLEGPGGDYVNVTYGETSAESLPATVRVHDAATGATETVDVQLDLRAAAGDLAAAAQEAAQTLAQAAGQTLTVPELPESTTAKTAQRQLGVVLTTLIAIPLVLMTQLMIVLMAEVMAAVMEAVAVAVAATVQAALLAAMTPLFVFASVLDGTGYEVEVVPLFDVFVTLPPPPAIDFDS